MKTVGVGVYSNEGYYFITICTQERKCILSKIMQNSEKGSPQLVLLHYGKIVEKIIASINKTYSDISIEDYVIMPNHIHFICYIINGNTKHINDPPNNRIPMLISAFKRLINRECNMKIWERNYYEHIIRNDNEYLEILEYIQNNPYKWEQDKYYN